MDQAGSTPQNNGDENSKDQVEPATPGDDQPHQPIADIPDVASSSRGLAAEATLSSGLPVGPGPGYQEADAPLLILPSRFSPLERERMQLESRRWARRRRRYTFFVRRTSRARRAERTSNLARAAWATIIVLLVVIVGSLTATASAASAYYNSEYTLLQGMQRQVANKDSVRIYDDTGKLLYQIDTDGMQDSITLADVPVAVVNATIAVEDHDFWTNDGVSFISIVRAAQADLSSGSITQGGSTITQQLIKQQVLTSDVTFTRKLQEAILAIGITENGVYSKAQILQMYLNSIPYSPTAYGIDAAAQEYFGYQDHPNTGETAAQQLDLAQASMLAGIPQNPNTNDPLLNFSQARSRQAVVLNDMVAYGYITKAQANVAWVEAGKPHFFNPETAEPNLAPHFDFYIEDILDQMITTGQLRNVSRSGLNIYTTLDLGMQNAAQQAIDNHLYGPDIGGYGVPIRDANLTNAAVLIADQHNGDIKVMLGSANYNNTSIDGEFNDVTQGFRGPGSSFKPLVYAAAFEKGWFPAMSVNDDPTTFWDGAEVYRPLDYDLYNASGQVTLRTALDWSLNIPAVKVMQFVGVDDVKALVERMGITQWEGTWGLSSVLGALDVTPFEMVQAYTVFANYGEFIPLHGIDKITDSSGDVLYNYVVPPPVQVLDPRVAFLITSILSDNKSRAGDFGGCSPLYLDPGLFGPYMQEGDQSANAGPCGALYANNFLSTDAWPTAAKTGTGQSFTDDWTMGYTMDYTGGVWAGNNNNTSMVGIDGITGAAPIFYHSMLSAEEISNSPKTPFPVPSGVHQMQYCDYGLCTTDWFLDNYSPPKDLGEQPEPIPCVTVLPPPGGWGYSSGKCDVGPPSGKIDPNVGAPPPIYRTVNGKLEEFVGAPK
ncbi:MAG: transglycosylase domain-containing protein [Ktedonobacterales bacterium]